MTRYNLWFKTVSIVTIWAFLFLQIAWAQDTSPIGLAPIREEDNRHRIIFEPEFIVKRENDYDNTVLVNIQGLTNIIESYVRRYPEHWGWIHRRWKTRPK